MLRSKLSVAHRDARRRAGRGLRCALAVVCFALAARAMAAQQMTVLFGTHVAGPGKGFSVSSFDAKAGALGKPEFVIQAEAPAYFILADDDRRLYTCNSTGFVSAYAVADGGRSLTLLSRSPQRRRRPQLHQPGQVGPLRLRGQLRRRQHCRVGAEGGRQHRSAHGVCAVHRLGRQPAAATHAYAHSIVVDPTDRFVLTGDLGVDKVYVHRFNVKDGSLTPNDPASVSITPGWARATSSSIPTEGGST